MHFGQKFIVRSGKERDDRGRGKGVLWIADSAWNWNIKIKLEENPDMEWRGENTFHQWFFAGQIKTLKNKGRRYCNFYTLGACHRYASVNSALREYERPIVKSFTASMLPNTLNLKEGAVVMLSRCCNVRKCLCNDTRLVTKRLHQNVVGAILWHSCIGMHVQYM